MNATIDEAVVRQTAKRCLGLAGRCIALEAEAATMRQAVDEIAAAVLADMVVRDFETGERITEPRLAWTARGEDSAAFHAEMDRRTRAAGLKPSSMIAEHCPALCAEWELSQAQSKLIAEMAPACGVNEGMLFGDRRREFLRIVIGLAMAA